MTKLMVALRKFATAAKKDFLLLSIKAELTLWPIHFGQGEERKEERKKEKVRVLNDSLLTCQVKLSCLHTT